MKHKVYAFIEEQPAGLVDYFSSLKEARACAKTVQKHGLKDSFGNLRCATAKIICHENV